jgi:predicted extracellular nuclease
MPSLLSTILKRSLAMTFIAGVLLAGLAGRAPTVEAISPNLVISQVYGGGGNTGAPYTHDFVELFNRGNTPASLNGMSVQYASSTGAGNFGSTTTQITELPNVTLAPGQYFLVQEAGGTTGAALPAPDVIDGTPIAMSATGGKVALVNSTTTLGCNGGSTPCNASQLALIVDLIGYDGANFFEGAPTPALSNTTGALRNGNGCAETDNNAADFTVGAPTPRNTASPLNPCPVTPSLSINDVSASEGASGTTSFDFTVSLSAPAGAGGVTFDIATADNTATTADNDYAANSLTGQAIPEGSSTYLFSVLVNGDATEEPDETFLVNVTNVAGATVGDDQGQGTIVNDDTNFCLLPFTPIYQIQGSGSSAAITGNVTTQGVVVGDFEGPTSTGLQGFYLQDATGDANAATSDGIFVFTGDADNNVSAGDVVRVTGFARERFNQTALNGSNSNSSPVTGLLNCGTASVAAVDVMMPFASATYLEQFEGMLVRFPQALVISEYFNYERFGEMVVALPLDGESRPFTGTAIDEPGAPALARAAANALRRVTLDDGRGVQNPETVPHPGGGNFGLDNRFRGGDTVQNVTGVLGFDFSLYRIQPTAAADYVAANPRPAAPGDVGGSLRVAAMNTLNFFLTLDTTASDSGPGPCGGNANLDCRGADADQPDEFTRQRTKLLAALAGLDADIIGLNELENTPGVDPLGDPTRGIVAGLNGMGVGPYGYIDTGVIGTDAIRVGLIYRTDKVAPQGPFQVLTSAVDPRFIDTKSRPVLAQTFRDLDTGALFTVAVNHFKSKGSDCNDVGDPDAGDGQGNCNGTRTLAAQALVDWLASDPTGSGDPDFLIMGDLNSYAREDPIDAILAGPDDTAGTGDDYINLIADYQGTYAYSYVFDGQAGYLDHALANASMASQVTGAADWHINADEPDFLDYDTSFKSAGQDAVYEPNAYRSSDHDPVVVGLELNDPPTVDAGGPYQVVEGSSVSVTATGSDPNPGDTLTYAWDLDNDGTFETPGQTATFSAAGLEAPTSRTIRVRVTDAGGLSATDEATVNVIYAFSGFFPPVDNPPTINVVNAGRAIPVKFRLGGDQGLAIFASGYPTSQPIACDTGAVADPVEETIPAGSSLLTYNATTQVYTYAWKTNRAWAGTCRQLIVRLNDGTDHIAYFRFN